MSISQLAREVHESPTLKLNEEARLLKERGEPVIHLGAGEPKSRVPIDAILASAAKLTTGEIRYTPTEGIPSLIKAIIRHTEEFYGTVVGPRNVMAFSGAKQAFYNLMMALINPQDEVLIVAPYWVSYPEIVRMVYGVPVIVTPESGRFEPTMDDIKQSVSSYTRAIIINSPNNPSGAVYSRDLIGELVEFCEEKGIYLVTDDIYHRLVFSGGVWTSPFDFATKDIEDSHVIAINGVSKSYAMTGFRIGWTVAPSDITAAMINVAAQNTSCPSVVAQVAAAGALNGIQSGVEALRLTLENNAKVMLNELKAFNSIRIIEPKGTFYCLPDFSAYEKSSVKLSKFLLEKARVVTVPGKEFGMESHLRLSYCGTIKDIKQGIERIKWALDPEAPNEIYIGDRKLRRDWK